MARPVLLWVKIVVISLILALLIGPARGQAPMAQPPAPEAPNQAPVPQTPGHEAPNQAPVPQTPGHETPDQAPVPEAPGPTILIEEEPSDALEQPDQPPNLDADEARMFFPIGFRLLKRLTFGGFAQVDYQDGRLGSSRSSSLRPATNRLAPFPAETELVLRRARLNVTLPLSENNGFRAQLPFEDLSGIQAEDAYYYQTIGQSNLLTVGQFKTPFGYEGLRAIWSANTIELSDATNCLYHRRDIGLMLSSDSGGDLTGDVAFVLGQGANRLNGFSAVNVLGRVEYHLTEHLGLFGSLHYGLYNTAPDSPTNPQVLPVRRQGVGARYRNPPFKLDAELLFSQGYNRYSGTDTSASGGYTTAVVQLNEQFDGVLSYDWLDPANGQTNLSAVDNALNSRERWVLGLNFYLDRKNYDRLMLNYEIHRQTEGPSFRTQGWRLRYQLLF